jgi:glucose-1-phosphate thymidylyltransferase
MKAIIPLAGRGTRLRPLTYHTPKPLLRVGGRPILSYLLDDVLALGVEEFVFVVGYLQDEMRSFIAAEYPGIRAHFVVQQVTDGTAGAIKLAEPWADEDLLILFSDTLFDADLSLVKRLPPGDAGVLWAMEVEDYQRFGVIVTGEDGAMERIVEKPSTPVSRLANIGVYYVRDHELLFEGIHHTLDREPGKGGEFYLTDAFQYMVDHGARLVTAPVSGWYDCGKLETLLDTNRHLLETGRGGVDPGARVEGTEIVEPVRVEQGAVVRGGRLGPNVTVETGASLNEVVARDTIIGAHASLEACELHDALVGARVSMKGVRGTVQIADDSVVESEP